MHAKLIPLKEIGKYYGSILKITDDKNKDVEIKIWHMGDYTPSERQLEDWGVKDEEEARREELLCDSHYETKDAFCICMAIIEGLELRERVMKS